MTISCQDFTASNSVSKIYTLVVYLVLKSPAWVIQRNDLVVSLHYVVIFYRYDESFVSVICDLSHVTNFLRGPCLCKGLNTV